jgi:hypothetical protein
MAKLDRLGWAAELSMRACGLNIGIRTNSEELLDTIRLRLPVEWRPSASSVVGRLYSIIGATDQRMGTRRFNILYANSLQIVRTFNSSDVLNLFESDLGIYLAENSSQRLFVHAAAVGWNNRVAVIPGRSQTGKSMLTRELIRAGATYYSDEYALFDRHGWVHPFHRPLSFLNQSGREIQLRAQQLGSSMAANARPISLVVLTHFKPAGHWKPSIVSRGSGVLGLLCNTPIARTHPKKALAILTKAVARATVLRGSRGEARETAKMILRKMDSESLISSSRLQSE